MTQVIFTTASTSPWSVPATFMTGHWIASCYANQQGESNYFFLGDSSAESRMAQTFIPPSGGSNPLTPQIDTVTLTLSKVGSPADNLTVKITDSSFATVYGTSAVVPGSSITGGFGANYDFTFATPVTVNAGVSYGIVVDRSGAVDASNYYRILGGVVSAYGSVYAWNGTSWVLDNTWSFSFEIGYQLHRIGLLGAGGNGAAGTTGTTGNGGGAGSGGIWNWFRYDNFNKYGTEINPGWTQIPFFVSGAGSQVYTTWCTNGNSNNALVASTGGNASGTAAGIQGSGSISLYPTQSYTVLRGWLGGNGGASGATKGGGGGGGAAGPNQSQTGGNTTGTSATGGAGGAAGNANGYVGPGSPTSATFGVGGGCQSGAGGSTSGAAGAGGGGGAGATATTTTGNTGGAGGATDATFDASHGVGGGGGGSGAATSTGTYTLTGGNAGAYGSGGGGCGYGRGTATFTPGVGSDGLIVLWYTPGTPPPTTQVVLTNASTSPFTFPGNCAVPGHKVEMVSAGGNSVAGTTTAGSGGGGGGGYWGGVYASGMIIPGSTPIPFLVSPIGPTATSYTQWGSSTAGVGNRYQITPGGAGTVSAGGAAGGTLTTATPTWVYTQTANNLGGAGGASGTSRGGGGGGGAGGPNAAGGNGGTSTGTAGAGGGGANNGATGNAANVTTTFSAGGQGSSGTPGNNGAPSGYQAASGTGASGGSGTNGVSAAGSTIYSGFGGNRYDIVDQTWDQGYGMGGGGGGCGANTASTGTNVSNVGGGGAYGGGSGGCGYVPSATITSQNAMGGLIALTFGPYTAPTLAQVILTKASTSPWTVPANFSAGPTPTTFFDTTAQASPTTYNLGDVATNTGLGEQFTNGSTAGVVITASFVLGKVGAPTDNLTCQIVDNNWNVIATSNAIAGTSLTTTPTATTFTFPSNNTFTLNPSTVYGLILTRSTAVNATNYYVALGNTASVATSQLYRSSSGVWGINGADATADLNWNVAGVASSHTVELLGSGGSGAAAGTPGTTGNSGGGGGGGAYWKLMWSAGTLTPGVTTVPFLVPAGGSGNTQWESSVLNTGNYYSANSGGNASTTIGGSTSTGGTAGTPVVSYTADMPGYVNAPYQGGLGGGGGAAFGGGGGGGCGGPNAAGGKGGSGTTAAGAGGGGGNNGTSGNAAGGSSENGGQGSSGAPGTSTGAAGTGNSGGAGSNSLNVAATTTGGAGGTDSTFDASHGVGGGGGGSGGNIAAVAGINIGGNGGYGGGGGGQGYFRGSVGGGSAVGVGGDGVINIIYGLAPVSLPAPPSVVGYTPNVIRSMYGPGNRLNATWLASPLPAITAAAVPPSGTTLTIMGVG